jgi:Protein of unknown function (DUF3024)
MSTEPGRRQRHEATQPIDTSSGGAGRSMVDISRALPMVSSAACEQRRVGVTAVDGGETIRRRDQGVCPVQDPNSRAPSAGFEPHRRIRVPVAQLRYDLGDHHCRLYRADRNSCSHYYDMVEPMPRLDELINEIDDDPTGIFCG